MKDFTRICKVLKLAKCSRAIDFVEKWESETKKRDASNKAAETASMMEVDNDGDLIAFDSAPRKINNTLSMSGEVFLDEDLDYKQQWYD